jgi:putative drug exporter of the RND superfamily
MSHHHPSDHDPDLRSVRRSGSEPILARFTRTMVRRRRVVVASWVVALALVSWLGAAFGGDHRVDYSTPGSDSSAARAFLVHRLPELSGDTVSLVVRSPRGMGDATNVEAVQDIVARVRKVAHVAGTSPAVVSPDGAVSIISVHMDATAEKIPVSTGKELLAIAKSSTRDSLQVEVGGGVVQMAESTKAGSEQLGLGAALVILLIVFGSALAAGLPLVIALVGVGSSLAAVPLLNRVLVVPDWAPQLVTMVGVGVGIDYALFIVTRYRAALRDGHEPEDAVVVAMTTAGRAVLFAGGTVVISLVGMCTMGLSYLYGTSAAVVLGVALVLASSMTLLPALLGFVGRSIDRFKLPVGKGGDTEHGMWARWSRVVQRRPAITGAVSLVVLLAVAAPVPSLRFGYPMREAGRPV